jgi:serine/threonine-protein kinase
MNAWNITKTTIFIFLVAVTLVFSTVLGFTIYESFFKLPPEVEVPAIKGKSLDQAKKTLEKIGIGLQVSEGRYKDDVPAREILEQYPEQGRKVRKGREVFTIVSMGPELVKVPDLKGKTLREAKMILAENKLLLGKVVKSKEKSNEPEQILAQSPSAQNKARRGAAVDIVINTGAEALVSVPRFETKRLSSTIEKLDEAGLVPGKIQWIFHEYIPRGEIIRQSPPPDKPVNRFSPVSFEVSAGRKTDELELISRPLSVDVPPAGGAVTIKVVLSDRDGQVPIYQGRHMQGDRIDLIVTGWKDMEIEIYCNAKLLKREEL